MKQTNQFCLSWVLWKCFPPLIRHSYKATDCRSKIALQLLCNYSHLIHVHVYIVSGITWIIKIHRRKQNYFLLLSGISQNKLSFISYNTSYQKHLSMCPRKDGNQYTWNNNIYILEVLGRPGYRVIPSYLELLEGRACHHYQVCLARLWDPEKQIKLQALAHSSKWEVVSGK